MPLCHSRCQLPGEIACSRVMATITQQAILGPMSTYARSHQLYVGMSSAVHHHHHNPRPKKKSQPLHDVTSPQFPADLGSHTPELNRLTASCLFGFSLAVWLLAAPSFSVCRSWASGSRGLPSGPNPIEEVDALATDSRILLSGMAGTQSWPNMEVHMPPSGGYLHGSGHGRS